MYKVGTKMIATILVMILTLANIASIGVYAVEADLEKQSTQTNHANVGFDAYFLEGEKQTHEAICKIGEAGKIYAKVSVKEAGYLKNAKIQMKDREGKSANFVIGDMEKKDKIQTVNQTEVTLNQINKQTETIVEIPILFPTADRISITDFEKENVVILTGIYVDTNGKEIKIEKEISLKLAWTNTQEIAVEQQVSKYIPYQINENAGVILQTILKANIKDNTLPVKQTDIQIAVPSIGGIAPKEVKVVSNSTKATNGEEDGQHFTQDNYTYDAQNKKLNITVKNEPDENGQIIWKKQAQDEYLVTYVYPEEVLSKIGKEGIDVNLQANVNIEAYHYNTAKMEAEITNTITLKEQISQIVSFEITNQTQKISKGYIYANEKATQKIPTVYEETLTTNIGLAELTDKISFTQKAEIFGQKEGNLRGSTTIAGNNYAYYKTITISKAQFIKVFGEEGILQFYKGDTVIATINKDTQVDENGNFVLDIEQVDCNELRVETSKPVTEGKLDMHIIKAIKGDIAYSKEQMKNFDTLIFQVIAQAYSGDTKFVEQTIENTIDLTEPETKADIVINKENLSTVVTNENVEIKAILRTDSVDNQLYTNPTIQIVLPAYIENINVKDVKVLFDDELKIKAAQLVQNADGTKSIMITLEGEQTKYAIGSVSGGTNVIITADIMVNKLTPNKEAQIVMNYTNSNTSMKTRSAVEQKQASTMVNFVAPAGVITTNGIANYAEGKDTLTSISGEEQTGVIETVADARNAKFEMSVINNYNNAIDNIQVLGRIPSKGNRTILTNQDLTSTFTMALQSAIAVEGIEASKVTIYYSENVQATTDLSNSSNGWTKEPTSLANIKSYLMVINDYTMNTGDSFNFNYTAQIPANLQHNENAYETYAVYFNNYLTTGTIQDKTEAAKVGVTTGKGAVLEANITSNMDENVEIPEGNLIKYTIQVKNTGSEIAKSVAITMSIPKGTYYAQIDESKLNGYTTDMKKEQEKIDLGNIEVGETISKDIWVYIRKIETADICTDESHYDKMGDELYHSTEYKHEDNEYKTTILSKATISAQNLAKAITTKEVSNKITKSYFTINAYSASGKKEVKERDQYQYNFSVRASDMDTTRKNAMVKMDVPEGMKYISTKVLKYNAENKKFEEVQEAVVNYNDTTRELNINLEEIDNIYGKRVELILQAENLPENMYNKKVELKISVSAENTPEEQSQVLEVKIIKPGLKISQAASIPQGSSLKAGEEFYYMYTIENIGEVDFNLVKFIDELPEELIYKKTDVDYSSEEVKGTILQQGQKISVNLKMPKKTTVTIKITVIADAIEADTNVVNKAEVSCEEIGSIKSNIIQHRILKADESFNDDTELTKNISGQVWIDSNKNGVKDADEESVSDVQVMLLNNQTGILVVDREGNAIIQKTDKEGNYIFKDIEKGSYTVIFLYDTANYSATTYQKQGTDPSINSDGIDTKITLDGEMKIVAITEQITVLNSNIYNIDLGLIVNPKFDLKLDKVVSKITVQNPTGTAEYLYNDSKLAKRDLIGKYIDTTNLVVEYKIRVTNEGAVEGYVKKIVDYLPTGLKFNSELNKDWYTTQNGMIFNASLANTKIQPGETKEVTLLLTMKTSEDNLGLINNRAEIYEAYNDLGLEDIDSIAGNQASDEDDMSSADILITVRTGETIMFFGLTLGIIIVIGIGAYFVKKKVLR